MFPSLVGAAQRLSHHAGVVDEDVQWALPPFDERLHGVSVVQYERLDDDIGVPSALFDRCSDAVTGLDVAHGQGHLGAGGSQRARRLNTDA
jgi:hypothetical protein